MPPTIANEPERLKLMTVVGVQLETVVECGVDDRERLRAQIFTQFVNEPLARHDHLIARLHINKPVMHCRLRPRHRFHDGLV